MGSNNMSSNSRRSNAKGKTPMEKKPKPMGLKDKYNAFFPIFLDEEGKRFYSLSKKKHMYT